MRAHEIDPSMPQVWESSWPGKFDCFSPFEFAAGIPQVMCAVATVKPNGQPNICLHAWNAFQGGGDGYRCFLPGIPEDGHTAMGLRHQGEFTVNFLSKHHIQALMATIEHNDMDADEFAVSGLHPEPSAAIAVPRIREAFLTLECTLESFTRLSPKYWMAIGLVRHAAADEGYMNGIDRRYGPDGFIYNVHSPQDAATGAEGDWRIATLLPEQPEVSP